MEHESKENVERVYGIGNTIKLDNKDLKLLEAYANNVRQSSIELAEKVNLSAETVRSRIKNLRRRK